MNGHRDLDKLKSRTASPSDNGHTSRVNPAEVTVGEVIDDDSNHPSSDDESDGHSDKESGDESADGFFDNTAVAPSEEVYSKFIQKYTENCSQVKVIQNWRAFDRERGRIMAKMVLRSLRSGLSEGATAWHRRKETKGHYIGKKNRAFENSFGKKHLWPGDLPEYRHENMKQEFINWMKIFGREVEYASFISEGNDCIRLHWEIEVSKYLENNN